MSQKNIAPQTYCFHCFPWFFALLLPIAYVSGMTSTPSKSTTILYDETVPICLLTKFQSYTGKYLYTYIQVRL